MKQTHDGKVIAGGDRLVSLPNETPNKPIREEWNKTNKCFAEEMFPFLREHQIKDTWTGLMPFS